MESTVEIISTATYFQIKGKPDGTILGPKGSIIFNLAQFRTSLDLVIFNAKGQYVRTIRYYRYISGYYHFPIHTLGILVDQLKKHHVPFNVTKIIPVRSVTRRIDRKKHDFVMNAGWTDRPEHGPVFEHLLHSEGSILGNDLQTGKGKSYIGVKMAVLEDTVTLVACDGLIDQWRDNFLEKTTIKPDSICVLQGHKSIEGLWDLIQHESPMNYPTVLIGSIDTLRSYTSVNNQLYNSLPSLSELCSALGVGLAIYDEIHLNTHAINAIILVTPVQKNIILSATPERAAKREQAIFNLIFPKGIIAGSNQYDRYVDACIEGYELDLGCSEVKFTNPGYGYNHMAYEKQLCKNRVALQSFLNKIGSTLHRYFIKNHDDKDKALIFVSTVKLANILASVLQKFIDVNQFNLKVVSYTAKDPIENLADGDVIVSTPLSCGVGKDISNLTTVINTVSVGSRPRYKQMFGRLRKIPGKNLIFIDLMNNLVASHRHHFWQKRKTLNACARSLDIVNVDVWKNSRTA
jgi:superfamily II DNA or RNA helicase